jgi:two-component system osmolarity sensor histidine kinase EnvZ
MTLLPRTLFGRNLLLLVGLIVASQLVSAVLVRTLIVRPRIEQLAAYSASNLEAIRAALENLPLLERERYIARLNSNRGLHVEPATGPVSGFAKPDSPVQRIFLERLSDLLPDDRADVEWKTEPKHTLWVRLYVGKDSYWVTAATGPLDLGIPRVWFWVTLASTLLAAIGAYLIQRHLDRPFQRLVEATGRIGGGSEPISLPETGPREIAALAHSFNRMSERLAAADAERAIMLAGVSHDLRSPLSKLRLAAEISADRIEPEIHAGMERNIESMDAIIGQFLDFARTESAEPTTVCDLNALLTEACEGQNSERPFELDLAPLPLLPLRRRAMTRLIDNLLENARRYGRPPIAVRSGHDESGVWFVVSDRGPGIAEDDLERVRRPFVRGDAARSGNPGAGLGLAIADRIVRLHGGRMHLASRPGEGLSVRIELPDQPARHGDS